MRRWSLVTSMLPVLGALYMGCSNEIQGLGGTGGSDGEGGSGGQAVAATSSSTGTLTCSQDCSQVMAPPCYKSVCDEGTLQCVVLPADGAPCNDGLFCTLNDTCDETGQCLGGPQNLCGLEGDQCHPIQCDEATDSCSLAVAPAGQACQADDPCTVNATCQNGLCLGSPKDCFFAPVPDECFISACNSATGLCEPQPGNDGAPCPSGGDPCLVTKICQAGVCQGGIPKDCSSFTNGCNNGTCDPLSGDCFAAPVAPGGTCFEASDDCNTGICDVAGNCLPTPSNEAGFCDDGNMCTMGETCAAGVCQGGIVAGYEVYFTETFASNAAGWVLGTEWDIGSAVPSSGGFPYGYEDPANDHTSSADNGLAGVVIGGYAQEVIHTPYYLVSPVIDTSLAAGSVYLEFWRMLSSDYTRYMKNTVDVFDGAQWVSVWASGGSPGVQDPDWVQVSYDLTAYKNANMQLRWGVEVGSSGVFTVSSWSVDDIVIANQVCGP
jgi:hypothetical protein